MKKYIIVFFSFVIFSFSISLNAYEVRAKSDEMGGKTLYCYHYYKKQNPPNVGGYRYTSSLMDNLQHYDANSEIGIEIEAFENSYAPYVYFSSSNLVSFPEGILILFKSGKRKKFNLKKGEKEGFFYKSKLVMSIEEMKEYFYNDIPVKMQVHFLHKDKKVVFSVTEVQQHAIATMTKFLFDKK